MLVSHTVASGRTADTLTEMAWAFTLYTRILVMSAVYVEYGAGVHAGTDALQNLSEVRATKKSNETQPAGIEYDPVPLPCCSQEYLWWLIFHAFRIAFDFANVKLRGR